MVYKRINITPATMPILTILNDVRNVNENGLDITPDYQRGYVWTKDYKDKLIMSIILNYPIGNIVINQLEKPNSRNAMSELVDGKQRLTTILKFVDGTNAESVNEFDVDSWGSIGPKVSNDIKEIIKVIINNENDVEVNKMMKKPRLTYRDLPKKIQNNIISYSLPVYTMTSADTDQIREYFKVLQNQEKLRAGEIINSLPDNNLLSYFNEVGYKLLENLNYQHLKRAELEKTYYSVLGVGFDKLQLNSEDSKIIDFVENLDKLDDEKKILIANLNENLNYIKNLNSFSQNHKMSKRTLKFIMGISMFKKSFFQKDTISKLEYVCDLSSKLAAFNSSASDDVSYTKYFGEEYSLNKKHFTDKVAPTLRTLYVSTARTTTKNTFSEAIDTLVTLYEDKIN